MNIACLLQIVAFLGIRGLDFPEIANIKSLPDLCPYTDYCTVNATKPLPETTSSPCCVPCSCAEDCWERANCCVDKQTEMTKQPVESCEALAANHRTTEDSNLALPRYYVTKSCPTAGDPLEEKCSGKLISALTDFIWVTDDQTQRIYNNKHCARCHGLAAYTPWAISVDCLEAYNGRNSPIDATQHILTNCNWAVVPPETGHNTGRCLIPEIDQCNVTGDAKTYDPALEWACNSFEQIYVEETIIRGVVYKTRTYKNVFCYLCNTPSDQQTKDVCTSFDEVLGRMGDESFMGIIDYTTLENMEKTADQVADRPEPTCHIDEITDPYQADCLKLSCPMKQAPVYGKCVPFISSTRYLSLRATFRLFPIWTKTSFASGKSEIDVETFGNKLFPKIRRGLGLSNGRCKVCVETIYGTYDEQEVLVMFATDTVFYTSEDCQEDAIVERMNGFITNEIKILIGQDVMALTVLPAPSDEFDAGFKSTTIWFRNLPNFCSRNRPLDLRRLVGCPLVSLNQDQYATLINRAKDKTHKKAINALFKFEAMGSEKVSTVDNFTVEVCFESYRSVLPQKNTGYAELPGMALVHIVTCTVIVSMKLI